MIESTLADPTALPAGLHPVAGRGYDGQFYTRLAFDPLTKVPLAFGIRFDWPAYRARDLAEPLAACLVLFGLVLLWKNRILAAYLPLTLAVLTRETSLVSAAGLSTALIIAGGRRTRFSVLLGATGLLIVFGAWQLHLKSVWGEWPALAAPSRLGFPGVGLMAALILDQPLVQIIGNGLGLLWCAWLAVEVLSALRRCTLAERGSILLPAVPWVLWTLFGLCFRRAIWGNDGRSCASCSNGPYWASSRSVWRRPICAVGSSPTRLACGA